MGKKRRISRTQAGRTDTYVKPTLRRPDAPDPIQAPEKPVLPSPDSLPFRPAPPDNSLSESLERLIKPIVTWGLKEEEAQEDQVRTIEQIRMDKLSTEQIRDELAALARQGEADGSLSPAANPFRKKVILEYAAERIMKDEYWQQLTSKTARFSNPLNNEDAALFARDTFESMGITGYFAQQKAQEFYNSMSSQWLSQVDQRRGEKLVARTHQDLQSSMYKAMDALWSNPEEHTYETMFAEWQKAADERFHITGGPGRKDLIASFNDFVSTKARAAALSGDSEDLERLEGWIATIREQKDGVADLSKEYLADLDELDEVIDRAIVASDRVSANEMAEQEDNVSTILNGLIYEAGEAQESEDPPAWSQINADPHSEFADELRRRAEEQGINADAITNVLVEDLGPAVANMQSVQARGNPNDLDAMVDVAINDAMSLSEREAIIRGMPGTPSQRSRALGQAAVVENRTTKAKKRAADSNPELSKIIDVRMERVLETIKATTQDPDLADAAFAELIQDYSGGLTEVVEAQYETEQERTDAVKNYMESFSDNLRSMIEYDRDRGMYSLNMSAENTIGLNPEITDAVQQSTQAQASEDLAEQVVDYDTDITDESEGLRVRSSPISESITGSGQDFRLQEATSNILSELSEVHLPGSSGDKSRNERIAAELPKLVAGADDVMTTLTKGKIKPFGRRSNTYEPFFGRNYRLVLTPNGFTREYFTLTRRLSGDIESDPERDQIYVNARRFHGLTIEAMETGRDENGYPLTIQPILKDPSQTIMINADTFEQDLVQVLRANASSPDLLQDQLLSSLSSNSLVQHYNAYRGFVGQEAAVSFAAFMDMQLNGPGRLRVPPLSPETLQLMKQAR